MSLVWLFPGQGAEVLPCLLDWRAASESVRRWIEIASFELSLPSDAFFERGGRILERTEILQPVLTALSLGLTEEIRARGGPEPDWTAGHSLGEIAALSAAGVLEPAAALRIASKRGSLMKEILGERPGGMFALTGSRPEEIRQALEAGRRVGRMDIAAINAPHEWVLSGDENALREVASRYAGVRLAVAGRFHGTGLKEAASAFGEEMKSVRFAAPRIGCVSGLTGRPIPETANLTDHLVRQFSEPVLWADAIQFLLERGERRFLTVGPGKILRGLLRKNAGRGIEVFSTETPADLEKSLEALRR